MKASLKRETGETRIEVALDLDGLGRCEADTGVPLLDEFLETLAGAAKLDLVVRAEGDLETGEHHTVEDVAITLGSALAQTGLKGMGSSSVPAGECLSISAVRFGEPGYVGSFAFQAQEMGGMSLENLGHFLRSLAYNGRLTLHLRAEGGDDRRKIEALALALGRALRRAVRDGSR